MIIEEIETYPDKCAGCRVCQLICSFTYDKVFNPSKARILIDHDGDGFAISFADECSNCGTCAEYCVYGALEPKRRERDAA